jgi:predicted secreted protein
VYGGEYEMAETMAIAGYGGKVYVGAASSPVAEVAEIGHWAATIALDAIETPKFQADRTRIAGKRDFTGSFDGSWYLQDANGQKVLQDAVTGGTTVYLQLLTKAGNTYSCWALITGEAIDAAHDGAVGVSFDFVSTGKVALTIASTSA